MSLINDALKRAHESQGKTPAGAPPLFPIAAQSRGGPGWILPTAIILLLAAGGLFLWAVLDHRSTKAVSPSVASIAVPQNRQTNPVPAVAAAAVPPSNATAATAPGTNLSVGFLPERLPKVQGIIYTESRPLAIVNGKIVNVGDQLGNFQVVGISRTKVTFQRPDGSQKELAVGQ